MFVYVCVFYVFYLIWRCGEPLIVVPREEQGHGARGSLRLARRRGFERRVSRRATPCPRWLCSEQARMHSRANFRAVLSLRLILFNRVFERLGIRSALAQLCRLALSYRAINLRTASHLTASHLQAPAAGMEFWQHLLAS